jgi:predicted ABC-type ATPase
MKELIVIAGANGSGKTTFSKQILSETGLEFLNADELEKELTTSKLQAGKEFFKRLSSLIDSEASFIIESTLSGKYLVKIIEKVQEKGYTVRIIYIYLENPAQCIQRIKLRVNLGGHFIPDQDVIRRFYRSKSNFWNIYKNLANEWIVFYNAMTENSPKIVFGEQEEYLVENEDLFKQFLNDINL